MIESGSDLSTALRARLREERGCAQRHASPEDLVAYRAGTLASERGEEIREHLVVCDECADLLLELAALEASPGGEEVSEFEVEAAWRRQRERLFGKALTRPPPGEPGDRAEASRRRPPAAWLGWAAAAGFAAVAFGLGFQVADLRRTVTRFYEGHLPRVIADTRDERVVGKELRSLELEPGTPGLVLLPLREGLPYSSYRVDFLASDDRSLLVRDQLLPEENLLVVPVTRDHLPSGTVRAVVSGLRESRHETIEEFIFKVRHR